MKIKQIVPILTLSGFMSLAPVGLVLAADSADIGTTGPNSTNTVDIHNSSNLTVTNTNNVDTHNSNTQNATSGNASVSGNTVGGSAQSGDAANAYDVATTIAIGNQAEVPGSGGAGGGGAGGGGGTPGSGGAGGSTPGAGGASASTPGMGGAGGGSAGVLPGVGCSIPCDVSALRAGYSSPQNAVQQTRQVSAGLLGLAALLSLIGAGGSAVLAQKRAKA